MKLIIKQYLASLKERNELDALLPDLLSQMGLNVLSRPSRGTRQHGVDVAAVGSLDGGPEKIYLFSIKPGDLSRSSWDENLQALRPSLNEIKDSYISHCLPDEHKDKKIIICLCLGGDIQEAVRSPVEGYKKENSSDNITYEEWNGDKLADLIQDNFLREDLLPENSRSLLRKALALLDEPESSFDYYTRLVTSLFEVAIESKKQTEKITSLRQMSICLWILFSWARDNGNLEAAYLSAERTLLLAWELTKNQIDKKTKSAKQYQGIFDSILDVYFQITTDYVHKILPHVTVFNGLSSAVRSVSHIGVNLKLFDLLGRLAVYGLWVAMHNKDKTNITSEQISNAIKSLILNNPTLLLPIKDDQAIDIFLTIFQLVTNKDESYLKSWLSDIIGRARFSYELNGLYPCTIRDYANLLEHPCVEDKNYRKEVTEGSILYPYIALWSAIFGDEKVYRKVADFKNDCLSHCNFQLWYPDELTEGNLYTNKDLHGATFSNVPVELPMKDFLKALWNECEQMQYFKQLSSQQKDIWPLTLLACRHYRIPIPVHFALNYQANSNNNDELLDNEK